MAEVRIASDIGDGLSEWQRNALAILTNLPVEKFSKLKLDFLNLSSSLNEVNATTLNKFIEFCKNKKIDLSNEGVNQFKDVHVPGGNIHPWRGVIGKQTAMIYFHELTRPPGLQFGTSYAKSELITHLNEIHAQGYEILIMEAAKDFDLQPSIIGGVGSRESFWGLILRPPGFRGTGDGGHGRGLMQIDDRWHDVDRIPWDNARANIRYGCDLLTDNREALRKEGLKDRQLIRATLASYNAGLGSILSALDRGIDVDSPTAGGDYGKDVLDRAGWFQKFASWH